jgi:hypothetical protein
VKESILIGQNEPDALLCAVERLLDVK